MQSAKFFFFPKNHLTAPFPVTHLFPAAAPPSPEKKAEDLPRRFSGQIPPCLIPRRSAVWDCYSSLAHATTASSLSSGSPSTFKGGQTRLAPQAVTFLLRMSADQQK